LSHIGSCSRTFVKALLLLLLLLLRIQSRLWDATAHMLRLDRAWPQVRVLLGEVDEAMVLLKLEKRHLFFDRDRETKVVVAWNWHKILVVIRGSYARANFIEDAKVSELFSSCCCLRCC
jgi:hypothetical protein